MLLHLHLYHLFSQKKELLKSGLIPNVVTFTTLIEDFCKAKRLNEANNMFLDMPKFGVAPTVPLYNSLMDGAFRSGNAQEALPLYQEMTRLGLCPHKFTNSIIVRGLCDQEKMQDWLMLSYWVKQLEA